MLVKTLGAHFAAGLYAKKCSCSALLIPLLLPVLLLISSPLPVTSHVSSGGSPAESTTDPHFVMVNKCCEKFEIHVDGECQQVNETGESNSWSGGKLPAPLGKVTITTPKQLAIQLYGFSLLACNICVCQH